MSGPTFIYLVTRFGDNSVCKIGISTNPSKRLRQLQTGNPDRLEVWFETPAASRELAQIWEMRALALFSERSLVGEWLACSPLEIVSRWPEWMIGAAKPLKSKVAA